MAVIETVGLTKQYPSVTALDHLDVSVGDGVTGLVGANGAGKSTLIKILLGLVPATEGTATVLGHDIARDGAAIRAAVGYMPEHLRGPAGRRHQPEQDLDHRGLARAVRADESRDAVPDGHVEVVERGDGRILLRQSDGLDHGHPANVDERPPRIAVPRSARLRLWSRLNLSGSWFVREGRRANRSSGSESAGAA